MKNTETPAFQEMMEFGKAHAAGSWLLYAATDDYASARCLCLNLLFPGLVLGAQAAEKFLKAFLLLANPKLDVRRMGHSLPKLLSAANALAPQLSLQRFEAFAHKFQSHYQSRYPDNPGAFASKSTGDRAELDEFVIFLNENLPCPITFKYRSGFYAAVTSSLDFAKRITPKEKWIKENNRHLAPVLPRIAEEYAAVQQALYPTIGNGG